MMTPVMPVMPERAGIQCEIRLATARIRKEYEPKFAGTSPAEAIKLQREMESKIKRESREIKGKHCFGRQFIIR
jgi:hypothetical protein